MDMCNYPLISIYIGASRQVHRADDPYLHRCIPDDAPFCLTCTSCKIQLSLSLVTRYGRKASG